jgi:hypothetical protein
MGNKAAGAQKQGPGGLSLAQVARVYSLPDTQLVLLSQICAEQKRHDSVIEQREIEDLPRAGRWEISAQFNNRLVLRALGMSLVKDTWLVFRQDAGTMELCTTAWFLAQQKFPEIAFETHGRWYVSHTSPWGIGLRCYGIAPAAAQTPDTIWQIEECNTQRVVLRTVAWYDAHRGVISAHRKGVEPRTPPTSPKFY